MRKESGSQKSRVRHGECIRESFTIKGHVQGLCQRKTRVEDDVGRGVQVAASSELRECDSGLYSAVLASLLESRVVRPGSAGSWRGQSAQLWVKASYIYTMPPPSPSSSHTLSSVLSPSPSSAPHHHRFPRVPASPTTSLKWNKQTTNGHHCILSKFLTMVSINLQQVLARSFLCILECTVSHFLPAKEVTPHWVTNCSFIPFTRLGSFFGVICFTL